MKKYLFATIIFGILFVAPLPSMAEEQLPIVVQGIGIIEDGNIAKAEYLALADGFNKVLLISALQYVPMSSTYALINALPSYLSYRGTNDISQYQITDKLKQDSLLRLTIDLRLKKEHLKRWLCAQTLNVPRIARPKIITMISSKGIEEEDVYEWWKIPGKKIYSAFESQLINQLFLWGENVIKDPSETKRYPYDSSDPIRIAEELGADLILTGSIEYIPEEKSIYSCVLNIRLIETGGSELCSWSASYKSDLQTEKMNSLMTDFLIDPVRNKIAYKILSLFPEIATKYICIEGISDYNTYQSIINALSAMSNVSQIKISKIEGHRLWHTIKTKGNLDDIMNNLKTQQIANVDIEIKDDIAFIRIISH